MYRLTVVYDEPADKEAFDRRYTDEHVPLVKASPGLVSFQLSHPQGGTPYLGAVDQTVFSARHAGLRSGGMGTVSDDIGRCESTQA